MDSQSSPSTSDTVPSVSLENLLKEPTQRFGVSQSLAASPQKMEERASMMEGEDPSDESSQKDAYIPYNLDDYQPLPEELPDEGVSALESVEQDPAARRLAMEEQAIRKERLQQARLERSLSALNSEHPHLRSMAIEELVSVKDPRSTPALTNVAKSEDLSADERRQAAQALWHHAADLEFANPEANQAVRSLARDSDPSVRDIAKRALIDMERYQRHYQN